MPRTNYPNIPKSRSSNEIQGTIFRIKWNIYFEDHKNLLSSKQVLFDCKHGKDFILMGNVILNQYCMPSTQTW